MSNNWHAWGHLRKPAGWSHLHRIAVGRNRDGRLEVFAVGTDGALWQIWQTAPNNGWSHWESRGQPTTEGIELSSPTVGRSLVVKPHQDGCLAAFVIASRSLWYVEQTAPTNGWPPWQLLGHPPASSGMVSIEVAQNHDGRLHLFAISYYKVLLLDIVDNSGILLRPDSRPVSRRSRVANDHQVCPVALFLLLLSNQRIVWSHLLHGQAVLIGSSGNGTRSNSCTVQRRHVSPAAIAGVRCR